jgi:hypothetical protein
MFAPETFDPDRRRQAVFAGHAQFAAGAVGQAQGELPGRTREPQAQAVELEVRRPVRLAALAAGVVDLDQQVQALAGARRAQAQPGPAAAEGVGVGLGALPVVDLAIEARREIQAVHEPARHRRRQPTRTHRDAARQRLGRGQ